METSVITDTARVWPASLPSHVFHRLALEGHDKTGVVRSGGAKSPTTPAEMLPVLVAGMGCDPKYTAEEHGHTEWLFTTDKGLLWVAYDAAGSWWSWGAASHVRSNTDRWHAALTEMLPGFTADESHVYGTFWAKHPMGGGYNYLRRLDAPPFREVEANYPASVRGPLTDLMRMSAIGDAGKLILFHGPPGTGKTRSILSLISAWSSWCDVHIITDPESFLNEIAYLNDVVLGHGHDDDRTRLLIIEDGDEFMDVDAKARAGQALSRLLNLADGLVGQGLRVLTLITTNVPMDSLNPAMARPGRCLLNLEFPAFPADEAEAWLAERAPSIDAPSGPATLAELYGMVRRQNAVNEALARFS